MQERSVPGERRIQGNPLAFHLRTFATSLREAGYQDRAMHSKVGLVADLGLWLGRTGLAITSHLDEQLLETFVKHKQRSAQREASISARLSSLGSHGPSSTWC
jgi:hypothetical protein